MARHVAALWSLLWIVAPAPAADWPVPRGPGNEPRPYLYDPAAWKTVPKDFLDDAPACILYAATTHLLEADGTVETITHEVTRFNGRKGIDDLGEYRGITYTPSFQKLTLNEARVHKADGRTVPVEPKSVHLRDISTDYQVYDHDKQLVISFPNLEVGDVLEVKWTTRGKNPEYGGQFFNRYTFGDTTYPVVRDEYRVRVPRGRALNHAAVGGPLVPRVRDDGATRTYFWSVADRRRLPQDDDLPPGEEFRLQVACSTFASWDEVCRWKVRLRENCWQCTPEIRKVVEAVTRGLATPEEKARALTYWVRRHVRYVAVGEKHDYTPHPPGQVLDNRYGDCKDQSQLLAVMLREAGVPVALVTLGTRGDGQVLPELPSPWGTHAILLVTLGGKEHWIDTTSSLSAWDRLPRDDRDRACYVIPSPPTPLPPGERGRVEGLRLARTPKLTADENRTEQETHVTVGADGSSRGVRTTVYHGSAATVQRDRWLEVPAGERRRLVAAELQDANSRTRLSGLALDEAALRDFDKPVTATFVYEVPGHFSGAGDREGSLTDSKVWGKLLAYNVDYERKVPLDLWAPFESVHRYVIDLPPAFRLDGTPRFKDVRSKWGSFTLTAKTDPERPRRLEIVYHTRLESARVEPADFDTFRKFQEEVSKSYRVWLTLKPTRDRDDAAALEAVLALAPDDGASAAALAGLYLDRGSRQAARRVLRVTRHYRPDDAALWKLTVKAAETLDEEEAAYRELLRRFPEELNYAVSLGAALADAGRHEAARAALEPVTRGGSPGQRALAHYQLARSHFAANDADKALEHFEAAERQDADSVRTVSALRFKGQVQERRGEPEEAGRAYREALRIDPDAEAPRAALIRLALAGGDRAAALEHLRRYTASAGGTFQGLLTAAEFHLRLGRYDDAFELASKARDQRFHEKAQRVLGLVHLHRGECEKAVYHLEKADPDAEVYAALIRARLALGHLREAEVLAEQADRVRPQPDELRRAQALVIALVQRRVDVLKSAKVPKERADDYLAASGKLVCAEHAHRDGLGSARAEALLTEAMFAGVELGPAYALRGLLELEKGRLAKALADAERAVALSPKEARGYYVRGRARLERGQDGAAADLQKAAELSDGKDALALHWLARALFDAGRREEARARQREAVKLAPLDAEVRRQLREFEKEEP